MPKSKPRFDEITLVLVVAVAAIIISIYSRNQEPSQHSAQEITKVLLDDHPVSIANNGVIDENKLKIIQNMGYEQFKDYINIKDDFCINIEDENGNLILAKGSSKLGSDGLNCLG